MDAVQDLLSGETVAEGDTLDLHFQRYFDDPDLLYTQLPRDFQKKRHVEYDKVMACLLGFQQLFLRAVPDEGMNDGIQLLAFLFLRENDRRRSLPIERPVFIENVIAKGAPDVFHGRTARPHCLARQLVPVNDGDTKFFEIGGNGAFSAAYAAG